MATNVLQFIYNADGSLLDKVNPFIASNNQAANNIQIIAPFPASDSVAVNYYLRNARISNYTQYLRLLKDTSGNIIYARDIVSPSKPYYQTVKDWNVWQIPISSKALRAISKYHAGKVDLSVTFREFKNFLIDETMEFKGTFGSAKSTTRGDIPLTANDGDYYRCDYLDFHSDNSNLDFTLMDLAIWDDINSRWIKGSSYEEALPTPSTEVGVDPSVFGMAIEDVEPTVTEQILDRISDLESIILGEVPEEVISQMFVRKNLELYYAELNAVQSTDKIYIERGTNGYFVYVSDLLSNVNLADVESAILNLQQNKADLVSGKVPLSQLPELNLEDYGVIQDLQQNKADLVLGKVPLSQLPTAVQNSVIVTQEEAPTDPINNSYWVDTEGTIEEPLMMSGYSAFETEASGDLTGFSTNPESINTSGDTTGFSIEPESIDTSGDTSVFDLTPESTNTSGDVNAFDLTPESTNTSGDVTPYTITTSVYDENGNFIG